MLLTGWPGTFFIITVPYLMGCKLAESCSFPDNAGEALWQSKHACANKNNENKIYRLLFMAWLLMLQKGSTYTGQQKIVRMKSNVCLTKRIFPDKITQWKICMGSCQQ